MHFNLFAQLAILSPVVSAFTHPGLLVNDADITRIKTKLVSQLDPWQASWTKLTAIEYSQSSYTNNAVSYVHRATDPNGEAANAQLLWHDAAAAFNLGLRWKIEGDETCAAAASAILAAWAGKLTSLDVTDDQYLTAGLQGYELVNAAELLLDYAPFTEEVQEPFTKMFETIFLSKNIFFLEHRAPSEHNVRHFFANWELANMASALAFGVFTDNSTLYNFVIDYFKNGDGNGAVNIGISNLVTEPGTGTILGQPQEAGRDQGHTGLDFQLFAAIAQQAWNQGSDLYGYNNSRILLGAEYYGRYNLGNDVPFEPYTNGIVSYTEISSASRGAFRPTWELLYAHYAQVKGLEAPWTELYRNHTVTSMGGFEGGAGSWGEGSGHYDGLGWGSLLYRLDADDVAALLHTAASTSATTATASASSTSSITPTSTSPPVPPTTTSTSISTTTTPASISSSTILPTSTSTNSTPSSTPSSSIRSSPSLSNPSYTPTSTSLSTSTFTSTTTSSSSPTTESPSPSTSTITPTPATNLSVPVVTHTVYKYKYINCT